MNEPREIAEVREVFSGALPQVFSVMAERGVLRSAWPLLKDALVDDAGIADRRVREGFMVALSTRCSNSYCFVSHSMFLCELGFNFASITALVEELRFPDDVDDHERWSRVLQWVYLSAGRLGDTSSKAPQSNAVLRELVSEKEHRHLFKICAAIGFLNQFSEYFPAGISVDNEEQFLDANGDLRLPVPDLVKYYEERQARKPIVSICMYCKKIVDAEGRWHAVENALVWLDRDSGFSHSICPGCFDKNAQ